MDLGLTDQVAWVAGSSRGIGKAVARSFLAEGCRTVISGRQPDALLQAQAELVSEFRDDRVMVYAGDLTEQQEISRALVLIESRWGTPKCIVANVGHGRSLPGWDVSEMEWQRLFEMNLWGSIRFVSTVLPKMIRHGGGSIVFIASITGVERSPAPLAYSAAKAALINYCKNLAGQVANQNVRVNSVAPGNILFPGGTWEKHLAERYEEVMETIRKDVPMQRFGRPEEIADLVVFLSSDRASFITGTCIVADGGQTRSI